MHTIRRIILVTPLVPLLALAAHENPPMPPSPHEHDSDPIPDLIHTRNDIIALERHRLAQLKEAQEKLHTAIATENLTLLDEALAQGANIHHTEHKNGLTPLMQTCTRPEKPAMTQALLDRKANPDATDFWGCTALSRTMQFESYNATTVLLKNGANPNIRTYATPLVFATENGSAPAVQHLLDHGATVSDRISSPIANPEVIYYSQAGQTALHKAITTSGDTELFSILLAAGANPNTIEDSSNQFTPLMSAQHLFESGYKKIDVQKFEELIAQTQQAQEAHAAAASDQNENPDDGLREQAQRAFRAALVKHKSRELLHITLKTGADINDTDADGKTALMRTTENLGSPEMACALLDFKADPNHQDHRGYTAVMHAINNYTPDVLETLVSHGATLTHRNHITPLMLAVQQNNTCLVQRLIELKAPVNARLAFHKDKKTPPVDGSRCCLGDTALHMAIDMGNPIMVSSLVLAGANPELANASGLTPLNLAATKPGNLPHIIERAIKLRAQQEEKHILARYYAEHCSLCNAPKPEQLPEQLSEQAQEENTALYEQNLENSMPELARAQPCLEIPTEELGEDAPVRQKLVYKAITEGDVTLLEATLQHEGADINHADPINGLTPLIYATAHTDNPEIIATLLTHKADIDQRDLWGCTALMRALKKEHTNTAQTLLEQKADVSIRNHTTPLHLATNTIAIQLAQQLIDNGASVNARISSPFDSPHAQHNAHAGQTALHSAVNDYMEPTLISLLVEAGANPDIKQKGHNRATAHELAEAKGSAGQELLDIITLAQGKRKRIAHAAASAESDELNKAAQAQVQAALRHAVKINSIALLKAALVDCEADIDDKDNPTGHTPLMQTTESPGNISMTKELIEQGADINRQNSDGYTALMLAIKNASYTVAELLMNEHEIDVTLRNHTTALILATQKQRPDIIQRLIDLKAPVDARLTFHQDRLDADENSELGNTALHIAVNLDNPEVASLLVKAGANPHLPNSAGQTPMGLAEAKDGNFASILQQAFHARLQWQDGKTLSASPQNSQ